VAHVAAEVQAVLVAVFAAFVAIEAYFMVQTVNAGSKWSEAYNRVWQTYQDRIAFCNATYPLTLPMGPGGPGR
jgi:hypothetical protein